MITKLIPDFFKGKTKISYKEAFERGLIVPHKNEKPFEILSFAFKSELPSEPSFYSEISVGADDESVTLIINRETKDETVCVENGILFEMEKAMGLFYLLGSVLFDEKTIKEFIATQTEDELEN